MSASIIRTFGVTPVLRCQRPNNTHCAAARLRFCVCRRVIHYDYTLTVTADSGPFLMLFSEKPHTDPPYRTINTNFHSTPSVARHESHTVTNLSFGSLHHNTCKDCLTIFLSLCLINLNTRTFRETQARLKLCSCSLSTESCC